MSMRWCCSLVPRSSGRGRMLRRVLSTAVAGVAVGVVARGMTQVFSGISRIPGGFCFLRFGKN